MSSEMDPAVVAAYLSSQFGEPATVHSVRQTLPGVSRETYLVDAKVAGTPTPLVIRTDPPSGPRAPVPLRVEWEVYQRLWGTNIPVAEPLWFDDRCELAAERPAMVRRMVEGSTRIEGLADPGPDGDELRRATAFAHAEALAAVHSFDWSAAGLDQSLDTPSAPSDAFRLDFETWRDRWHELKTAPFPIVTEALYWLEDHRPDDSPRISLTKGSNGLGKEIWHDGRIVAMSDWELAQLSDGALDWGFSQSILALHDRDETISHYEQHVGFELPRERLAYAIVFTTVKLMTVLNSAMWAYLDQRDRHPVLATMGLGLVKNLEHRLASVVGGDLTHAADVMLERRPSSLPEGI